MPRHWFRKIFYRVHVPGMHFLLCIFVPRLFFPVGPTTFGSVVSRAGGSRAGWRWKDLSLLSSAAFLAFADRWHSPLTQEQPEQRSAHEHTMVPV